MDLDQPPLSPAQRPGDTGRRPERPGNGVLSTNGGRSWYSAAVLFRVTIGGKSEHDARSIFVFRALTHDWPATHARALELGRAVESSYLNADGQQVEWRLLRVETLDMLGEEVADGREVWWEALPTDQSLEPTRAPEDQKPGQTGV